MSAQKLYVENVSFDTTETALRQHFARMGPVIDVEILDDQRGRAARAHVTMATDEGRERALTLDGVELEGRALRVSSQKRGAEPRGPKVKLVQQYRVAHSMIYELDGDGTPIVIRLLPGDADDDWVVEARASTAPDALSFRSASKVRLEALRAALEQWNARAAEEQSRVLDIDAIAEAMRAVRAV